MHRFLASATAACVYSAATFSFAQHAHAAVPDTVGFVTVAGAPHTCTFLASINDPELIAAGHDIQSRYEAGFDQFASLIGITREELRIWSNQHNDITRTLSDERKNQVTVSVTQKIKDFGVTSDPLIETMRTGSLFNFRFLNYSESDYRLLLLPEEFWSEFGNKTVESMDPHIAEALENWQQTKEDRAVQPMLLEAMKLRAQTDKYAQLAVLFQETISDVGGYQTNAMIEAMTDCQAKSEKDKQEETARQERITELETELNREKQARSEQAAQAEKLAAKNAAELAQAQKAARDARTSEEAAANRNQELTREIERLQKNQQPKKSQSTIVAVVAAVAGWLVAIVAALAALPQLSTLMRR